MGCGWTDDSDSEGYSKLITALAAFGDDTSGGDGGDGGGDGGGSTPSAEAVAAAVRSVQSLIGYFDLDPNRALDLVLEAGPSRSLVYSLGLKAQRRYRRAVYGVSHWW